MSKKLYRVEVTYEAVVYAEDEHDARDYVSEIRRGEDWPDVYATQITSMREAPDGWDESTLIYHPGSWDLTLGEALGRDDG